MARIDYQSVLALIEQGGLDTGEFVRDAAQHAYQEIIDASMAARDVSSFWRVATAYFGLIDQ